MAHLMPYRMKSRRYDKRQKKCQAGCMTSLGSQASLLGKGAGEGSDVRGSEGGVSREGEVNT